MAVVLENFSMSIVAPEWLLLAQSWCQLYSSTRTGASNTPRSRNHQYRVDVYCILTRVPISETPIWLHLFGTQQGQEACSENNKK